MTTRRLSLFISLVACGAVLAPVAPAEAKKKAKTPTIKRVTPMRVKVGHKITIRGINFSSKRKRDTVMFRAPNKRTAFAKPSKASRGKLVVKVPAAVERLLSPKPDGSRAPARFKLRVVTKGYGKLSSKRVSPVIVSASGPPPHCPSGTDADRDGLTNSREAALKTDPCLKDTDGDGAEDYFEVESALDLNPGAVPSTAKRSFPNALYPDGENDYDGDGLTNHEESAAWAHSSQGAGGGLQSYSGSLKAPAFSGPYGGVPFFGGHGSLNYSDGRQATVSAGPGSAEYRTYLDLDGSGSLTDDERDADGDGLGNVEELRGLMYQRSYSPLAECATAPNDYTYRPLLPREMDQVDWLASDTDGDGVWDGNDDQDTDGVSNVDEILPPYQDCKPSSPAVFVRGPVDNARDGSSVLRAPYNPCLPDANSPVCARYGGA